MPNFKKLIWLADVLRAAGLTVVEQEGWKSRGRAEMATVRGVLCHHTAATSRANAPSLGIVQHGRPDLTGPLAHLVLGRDGTYYVVAAGRCNHAGAGNWKGVTTGNASFIGIEAENSGLAMDNPWPAVQMDAYVRGVAALLMKLGASSEMCASHLEYALPVGRKSDPSFSVGSREQRIAAFAKFRQAVDAAMMTPQHFAGIVPPAALDEQPGDVETPDLVEVGATAKVETTSAEDHAQELSAEEINSVAERLRKLGYHEVGLANGKWGGRLAAAIAAYKNDRHLSGEPAIDAGLLDDLSDAERAGWSRPIAKERAEGVPDGSRIVAGTQRQATGVFAFLGTIGAVAAQEVKVIKESIGEYASFLTPVADLAKQYWWLLALAFAAYVLIEAAHIRRARVEDHQQGKTT